MGARRELDLAHMRAGFTSPVYDAQACFRHVLEALARPGQIQRLDALPVPPAGLGAAWHWPIATRRYGWRRRCVTERLATTCASTAVAP